MAIGLLQSLQKKLHPGRFSAMSPKMAAIVGFIVGCTWTKPNIVSLTITSDGFLLTDYGNQLIGTASDLERNWSKLLEVADLTAEEEELASELFREKISDWRNY